MGNQEALTAEQTQVEETPSAPRFEHNPQTFVGPTPNGKHVFVGVGDRAKFDAIALPCIDHGENKRGQVLTKTIEANGCCVVFQHWIKSLTMAGYAEDVRERRASAAAREHDHEPRLGRIGENQ